ncbi:MAG: PAS domain S-box protein [Verrucomicrobia bacterium]|nr:MAG: PAS domain S-box protein [Verrucomicrobiota bacterium]TAE86940.1 MAG: PAS domain S-box protein [Verrucomicrobiota bacterium]TAF24731.1 MAG: PAS domain S-box protein [Verrucomicrobiota bacterium]
MNDLIASLGDGTESLRERAEAPSCFTRSDIEGLGAEEIEQLVYQLQTHQTELRLQNEELRRSHGELLRSRDRFSELYDGAPAAYVILDGEGRILEANRTAAMMFGCESGVLRDSRLARFVVGDSQDIVHRHLCEVFGAEGPRDCELFLRRTDGHVFAARMESRCSVARGESAGSCWSVIVDISARKRSEQKLRQLNETLEQRVAQQTQEVLLLSVAVSHLAEGVVITGSDLSWPGPSIVFVNPAMCRITGYTAAELIGGTPRILQGPTTDRAVFAKMLAELAANRSCQLELVNYRKDGSPYPAEMFITPMFDSEGRHTHYVSIHRDITERKRAEDALTSLGRIIEDSRNEIYIFDASTLKFLQVNRGGRENLGYSMEELRRLTPLDIEPSFDRASFDALVEPLRSGKALKLDFETRHRRKDGSFYHVEVALQMADYRGCPSFVAIVLDTSLRRELEQEVVKASEEERQRIAHDLHDDLGSLLTGLKLRIEAVAQGLAESMGGPIEGCGLILETVRDAITRTRQIARGLRPVGNDPEDLMGALRGLATRTEESSGIICRFQCPGPVLVADSHASNHLFRIAQEAVNNAVKHAGGSWIVVSLRDEAGAFELEVLDDGRGFDVHGDHAGLGLHIMNYRASAMKASLRIGRAARGGTSVRCMVPKAATKA